MKRCGACGAGARRLHAFALCGSCHNRLERWVAHQVEQMEKDLDLLAAFEEYCWRRERRRRRKPTAGV